MSKCECGLRTKFLLDQFEIIQIGRDVLLPKQHEVKRVKNDMKEMGVACGLNFDDEISTLDKIDISSKESFKDFRNLKDSVISKLIDCSSKEDSD